MDVVSMPSCTRPTEFILEDARDTKVPVDLIYDTNDPYAVCIQFHATPQTRVNWYLARELLAGGLYAETGEGDVVIRPHLKTPNVHTQIKITSPSGSATFRASRQELRLFLDSTETLCASGQEGQFFDFDTEMDILANTEGES